MFQGSNTANGAVYRHERAAYVPISEERKLEIVAQFTDDVLTQLGRAFIEAVKIERWGKRDLARITGLNETGIGHVLAGRRRNLTVGTIALLARAMKKRPQLTLVDVRPKNNDVETAQLVPALISKASALDAFTIPEQPESLQCAAQSAATAHDVAAVSSRMLGQHTMPLRQNAATMSAQVAR
jgi:ABC-type Mn2+/Zn2+ transport system ATPase subunit